MSKLDFLAIFTFLFITTFITAAPNPTNNLDIFPEPMTTSLHPIVHQATANIPEVNITMTMRIAHSYVFRLEVPRDSKLHWVINLHCYLTNAPPGLEYGLYNCSNFAMLNLYLSTGGPCVLFDSMSWPIHMGPVDFLRDGGRGTQIMRAVCCGDNCPQYLREEDGGPLPLTKLA